MIVINHKIQISPYPISMVRYDASGSAVVTERYEYDNVSVKDFSAGNRLMSQRRDRALRADYCPCRSASTCGERDHRPCRRRDDEGRIHLRRAAPHAQSENRQDDEQRRPHVHHRLHVLLRERRPRMQGDDRRHDIRRRGGSDGILRRQGAVKA